MNKEWFKYSRRNEKDKLVNYLKAKYNIDGDDFEKLVKL
jgi:hypothetical protein